MKERQKKKNQINKAYKLKRSRTKASCLTDATRPVATGYDPMLVVLVAGKGHVGFLQTCT